MPDQIVEITKPGYRLNKKRGFLEVHDGSEKMGQVPFDDILALIISVPGASISTVLIDELCQRNIPLVVCGANFLPSSLILPVSGYGRQFQVMHSQISLSEPRRKRAWQKIIQSKIYNQAKVVEHFGRSSAHLLRLIKKVQSGDANNCEAHAARIYWQELFGNEFRRDRNLGGLNAALNYSYAVVRACVARGLAAAGLHPSFSLHHKNPQNPINLVDDFIEPFRPLADMRVRSIIDEEITDLTPPIKAKLVVVTNMILSLDGEHSPMSLACVKVARGFANYIMKKTDVLSLPKISEIVEQAPNEWKE